MLALRTTPSALCRERVNDLVVPGAPESEERLKATDERPEASGDERVDARTRADRRAREQQLVREHMPAIWRFLRRLGFAPADAEDATQEIFVVAVGKLDQIEPGRERNFLFGIAVRFSLRHRRSQTQRAAKTVSGVDLDSYGSNAPEADELLDQRGARALLEKTMSEMPPDLRTTFALYELEEMTTAEIASLMDVPLGTVASRLRRAREVFQEAVARFQRSR